MVAMKTTDEKPNRSKILVLRLNKKLRIYPLLAPGELVGPEYSNLIV
jgi:hypothetical protein